MFKQAIALLLLSTQAFANNYAVDYTVSETNCALEYTEAIHEALVEEGLIPPTAKIQTNLEVGGITFSSTNVYESDSGTLAFTDLSHFRRGLAEDKTQLRGKNSDDRELSLRLICENCVLNIPSVAYCRIWQSACDLYGYRELLVEDPTFTSPYPTYWKDGADASVLEAAAASAEKAAQSQMTGECSKETITINVELI